MIKGDRCLVPGLLDQSRSGDFHVTASEQHPGMVLASLQVMNAMDGGLCFNICQLETSYLCNREISNLPERVKKCISPHLSYSCRFWAYHLQAATSPSADLQTLKGQIRHFLHNHLLHWLELLSLIEEVNMSSRSLLYVSDWAKVKLQNSSAHNGG